VEYVHELLLNINILDILTYNEVNYVIFESFSQSIDINTNNLKCNWVSVNSLPFINDHTIFGKYFIQLFIDQDKFIPLFKKLRQDEDDNELKLKYRFNTPAFI